MAIARLALAVSLLLLCTGCEDRRGVKIGTIPPPLSGRDLSGRSVNLGELKGKVAVVYFWTDSCCGNNLKEMQPVYQRYRKQGLEIVALNVLDSAEAVASYVAKNNITFTMVRDVGSVNFNAYEVRAFPSVYLLDRDGVVREKVLGSLRTSKMEQLIRQMVEQTEVRERGVGAARL